MDEFTKIKHKCLVKRESWCDPEFPAEPMSLFYHQVPDINFEWKRPHEIYPNPCFVDKKVDGFDVVNGTLGDPWLLGCIEILHTLKGIYSHVVPPDQGFCSNYAGVFRFRIWWGGKWEEVLVDDRLPTVDGKLVFIHNTQNMQLWAALLEKAYAKLHGSYEALKYGNAKDGLVDFTGAIVEHKTLPLHGQVEMLHNLLNPISTIAMAHGTSEMENGKFASDLNSNLFLIYEIDKVMTAKGGIYLVRIVRPLPQGKKESKRFLCRHYRTIWNSLSASKKLEIITTAHGFWVPFDDFSKIIGPLRLIHFEEKCCTLEPSLTHLKKWSVITHQANWVKGVSAGGCKNHKETFHLNPQFQLVVKKPTPIVIELSQTNILEPKVIGFSVYKFGEPLQEKATADILNNSSSFLDSQYSNARHVSEMATFEAGTYLLVPTTYDPRKNSRFTVRIFSLEPVTSSTALEVQQRLLKPIFYEVNYTKHSAVFKSYVSLFLNYADEHKTVDAFDLQDVLMKSLPNDYVQSCTTIDSCRQIILALDNEAFMGRISLKNYKKLLYGIWRWEEIFRAHATKRRGVLVVEKLHAALRDVGFVVNDNLMAVVVFKYMKRDCTLRFGDFVSAIFYLCKWFKNFEDFSSEI